MATAIQRRRGTSAQHSGFTGLAGEITIDTTNNTVVVHDGSTAGGHRLAKYSEITALGEGDITGIVAGAGLTGDATSGDATLAVGAGYGITVNANDVELTNSSVRALFSAAGDLSYNASSGAFSFTNDAGDIEGVTAGTGLSGGGTSGTVTLSTNDSEIVITALSGYVANEHIDHSGVTLTAGNGLSGGGDITASRSFALDLNELTAADVDVGSDLIAIIDAGDNSSKKESISDLVAAIAGTGLSASSGQLSLTDTGYVTGVTAGTNLTGGGTEGTVTVNLSADPSVTTVTASGNITAGRFKDGTMEIASGSISSAVNITATGIVSFGTLTDSGESIAVAKFVDEADGIGSNDNDTSIPTSAAVKNYVDVQLATKDALSELSGDSDDVTEGTTNLFFTAARARGNISVTDAGGDGSLAYNNGTGVITYTGPSASEVRAHISGGTGVTVSSGEIAIGQAVGTTDAVTFGSAIISGNLTVNGTTTTVNSNTVNIGDNILVLNSDEAGTPSQDGGIEIERGTSTNKTFLWDETNDRWTIGSENFVAGTVIANLTGDVTGDVTGQVSSIGNHDTGDLSEGSSLYFTAARARGNISVTDNGGDGALSYDSGTGVISYTGPSAAEVRAHISGGYGIDISSGEIATSNSDVRGLFSAGGDLSYNSTTGVFSFTNDAGDIESVTAGNGLTGGGSSGGVTLNVVGGYGVTANADDIEVSNADIRGLFSAGGDLSYDSGTGQFSFTNDAGDIESVQITAGVGLSGGGTGSSGAVSLSLAVDLSELTDMTGAVTPSEDELILLDNGADRRKLISEIGLSAFSNDSGFTTNVGDITGVTAGTGLSGGGSSGGVTLDVSGLTVSELAAGSLQTSLESFSDSDSVLMTAAAVNDRIQSFGYTTNVGDITGVTAGSYLTGGGSSGGVTLNVDATTAATASKIVARDSAGNVAAAYFVGTATQAQYADLAEKYESDAEYDAGTVIVFGGEKEITSSKDKGTSTVAGVISNEPAYMMNSEADGQYVALCGRVPCKVVGPVSKGDLLIASDIEGHAEADNDAKAGSIIGKAIGSHNEGEGVIEVLVNLM